MSAVSAALLMRVVSAALLMSVVMPLPAYEGGIGRCC